MKSKRLNAMVLISGLILSSAPAFAGPHKHRGPMKKALQELGLSEDQQERIKDIHRSQKEERKARRAAMNAARKALHEALQESTTTDSQLEQLHEAVITQKASMMRGRFAKMLKIRDVLNPEQRTEFQLLMKKYRPKKGKKGMMLHHQQKD